MTYLAGIRIKQEKTSEGAGTEPVLRKANSILLPALDPVFSLLSASILPGLSPGLRHPVLVSKKRVTLGLPATT